MRKKSQVTIFVILIIIILVVAGFMFFSTNKARIDEIRVSQDTNLKEITPVKIYIENVIRDLMIDGLFILGKQGGVMYETTWPYCKQEDPVYTKEHRMCNQSGTYDYLNYPKYLENTPYLHQRVGVGINESRFDEPDMVTHASKEPLQQPYAYPHYGLEKASGYLYGSNTPFPVITGMSHPKSIEYQLSNFTAVHFPSMLDFTDFERRGYDIEVQPGYPRVTIKVNENDVTARVYYNVTVDKSGIRYVYDEFFVDIDYSFKRLYLFIQKLIEKDTTTLDNIMDYKMKDDLGETIGEVYRLEDAKGPPKYDYDMIYVIDRSFDWQLMYNRGDDYNPEPEYYTFYFLRENRPADASTVYFEPAKVIAGDPITWYCPNFQTIGQFFDPDEDDMYTPDFPFTNPQWYQWYSRGDLLIVKNVEKNVKSLVGGDVYYECPVIEEIKFHNEPDSRDKGPSWTKMLGACGNNQYYKSSGTTEEDVGDVIILKVGDQMDFPIGAKFPAPLRYPDSPILEQGFGRLNDVISFRPVQCEKGLPLCGDSRETCGGEDGGNSWKFNKPASPPQLEDHCLKYCYKKQAVYTGPGPNDYSCEPLKDGCIEYAVMKWHVDHKGECVPYYDIEEGPIRIEPVGYCDKSYPLAGSGCHDVEQSICESFAFDEPSPADHSASTIGKIVCCANHDGTCQDILESECDPEKGWTLVSDADFCNQLEECQVGCCSIRGSKQILAKQKWECTSLCKDSGQCDCDTATVKGLDTCNPMGDGWDWDPNIAACPQAYNYIKKGD